LLPFSASMESNCAESLGAGSHESLDNNVRMSRDSESLSNGQFFLVLVMQIESLRTYKYLGLSLNSPI